MSQPTFKLFELQARYEQESDTNCPTGQMQELVVRTEDSGSGCYIILETTRWAINDASEIAAVLADFATRAGALLEELPNPTT